MTDERKGWTSASNAEADLLCPGRHAAQRGLPEVKSDDGESGTRIHAALAEKESELSDDERGMVASCKRIADEIISEWRWLALERHTEERLWITVGTLNHSGQPDLVLIHKRKGCVIDYKSGRNEVQEPNTNQQLRDLAVLASRKWKLSEVTVSIVQPFAKRQPPCVYSKDDLKRAYQDLCNRVRQSNNPLAVRVAGEKQCRWCRAARTCPEYDDWAKGALPSLSSGFEIQKPWTPEQWASFLTIAPEAEKWIEAKKDEARALLRADPEAIPGYELKPVNREKITNVQGVFEESTKRGVSQDEFMKAVSVTKSGLKSALRSTGLKGKELESTMTEILFHNTTPISTEERIVRK